MEPECSDLAPARATVSRPVVIEPGKRSRKQISQLKRGEGELWTEVSDAVQLIIEELGDELRCAVVVPVVLVSHKKKRTRRVIGLRAPVGT